MRHVAVIGYGGPETTNAIAQRPEMIPKTFEANMLTICSMVVMVAGLEETGWRYRGRYKHVSLGQPGT